MAKKPEPIDPLTLARQHARLREASQRMLREVLILMMNGCRDEGIYNAYKSLQNAVLDQELWKEKPEVRVDTQP